MKVLWLLLLVFLVGCSASAYDERQDQRILDSLEDPVLQNNPQMLLSKCYSLSEAARGACYNEYRWVMDLRGLEIPAAVCERIGCS